MMQVALLLLGLVILWSLALASRKHRNLRFLSFLALATVIILGAASTDQPLAKVLVLLILAIVLVALLWPARLQLSSMTPTDSRADEVLRALSLALDDSKASHLAPRFGPSLEQEPFRTPPGQWADAGRLFRMVLARIDMPGSPSEFSATTPTSAYRSAARDYWRAALQRRVIGRHPFPSAWDEDVLLRCIPEEFDRVVPSAALAPEPLVPIGDRSDAAQRMVDEVKSMRMRHPASTEMHRLIVESLTTKLDLARGDRSRSTIERANAAAEAVNDFWPVFAAGDPNLD